MAIGRPIELTPNVATKNISSIATANQTEFTVTGGYRINEISVYRNGVRLSEDRDFTASDGDTVTLISAATVGDLIEFQVFDSFNVSSAIVSAASSQTLNGNLNVTGTLYGGGLLLSGSTNINVGIITASTALHVGSALTSNAAGDVETIGIITAASFSGSGANLTSLPVGTTITVADESSDTTCFPSFFTAATGDLAPKTGTNLTFNSSSGALTATSVNGNIVGGTVSGTTGTFSGAVNVDDTTDSTSSSTGALIVDGGLGVAKNVYIGAGLSVAGTLTYEDVTNVDSVGMVTAKSGLNVSGGEVTVGSAVTIGSAGVTTFIGAAGVGVTITPSTGKVEATTFYGDGSNLTNLTTTTINNNANNRLITGSSTANTLEAESALTWNGTKFVVPEIELGGDIKTTARAKFYSGSSGEYEVIDFDTNGETNFRYQNSTRIQLISNGTRFYGNTLDINCDLDVAGVGTYSEGVHIPDSKNLQLGNGADFTLQHNATNSIINNNTGTLLLTSDDIWLKDGDDGDVHAKFIHDGAVELYWDNNEKLATQQYGVDVQDSLFIKGAEGTAATLNLFADESDDNADNWRIVASADNNLYFQNYTTGAYTTTLKLNPNGAVEDSKGDVRQIIYQNKTSGYTLVASDAGKAIHISTGGVTINNSLFSAGDAVSIINNSGSDQTITQGSGVTLYNSSDASTGNKTLSGRGMCTVWFSSASVGYISGNI